MRTSSIVQYLDSMGDGPAGIWKVTPRFMKPRCSARSSPAVALDSEFGTSYEDAETTPTC